MYKTRNSEHVKALLDKGFSLVNWLGNKVEFNKSSFYIVEQTTKSNIIYQVSYNFVGISVYGYLTIPEHEKSRTNKSLHKQDTIIPHRNNSSI